MSKMNALAMALGDLITAGNHMQMCAQKLQSASDWLRSLCEAEETEEPKTPKKKATAKKATEPEETTPEPEPQATDPTPEQPAPEYTKEQIRGMLSDLAGNGHREEAKALVSKYANGGSFSDIDPARYPELAQEVQKINA